MVQHNANILVQVDKTVVRVTGLKVTGLNTTQLEDILKDRLKSLIRVIGVTGDSLEMDVYGVEESDILRDEEGLIQAIATAEGITLSDLSKLSMVKKIQDVDFDNIPPYIANGCKAERWAGKGDVSGNV